NGDNEINNEDINNNIDNVHMNNNINNNVDNKIINKNIISIDSETEKKCGDGTIYEGEYGTKIDGMDKVCYDSGISGEKKELVNEKTVVKFYLTNMDKNNSNKTKNVNLGVDYTNNSEFNDANVYNIDNGVSTGQDKTNNIITEINKDDIIQKEKDSEHIRKDNEDNKNYVSLNDEKESNISNSTNNSFFKKDQTYGLLGDNDTKCFKYKNMNIKPIVAANIKKDIMKNNIKNSTSELFKFKDPDSTITPIKNIDRSIIEEDNKRVKISDKEDKKVINEINISNQKDNMIKHGEFDNNFTVKNKEIEKIDIIEKETKNNEIVETKMHETEIDNYEEQPGIVNGNINLQETNFIDKTTEKNLNGENSIKNIESLMPIENGSEIEIIKNEQKKNSLLCENKTILKNLKNIKEEINKSINIVENEIERISENVVMVNPNDIFNDEGNISCINTPILECESSFTNKIIEDIVLEKNDIVIDKIDMNILNIVRNKSIKQNTIEHNTKMKEYFKNLRENKYLKEYMVDIGIKYPDEYLRNSLERCRSLGLKNRAEYIDGPIFARKKYTRIENILDDFTEEESKIFNEKFHYDFKEISKIVKRPMSACIIHYYQNYRERKKTGRISDTDLKLLIESRWSESELNTFKHFSKYYKKEYKLYKELFPSKTENELKMVERYVEKFMNKPDKIILENSEGRKVESVVKKVNKRNKSVGNKLKKKVLESWNINERQLFAIYYPFVGRNWLMLSSYIESKKPADVRTYHRVYFKYLSKNEQKLEASLQYIKRDTYSMPNTPKIRYDDIHSTSCGVLFAKERDNDQL
ncbi:hypothetical protein SLOPH_2630, partial [Spraguea lophii 42_110]